MSLLDPCLIRSRGPSGQVVVRLGVPLVDDYLEFMRLLGNGYCTRPTELDCAFEAICENCSFFQTSIEFRPTLQAQHDDAAAKGQHHRTALFDQLLTGLTEGEAS